MGGSPHPWILLASLGAETGGVPSSPSLIVVLAGGPVSLHANRPCTRAVLRPFLGPERIRSTFVLYILQLVYLLLLLFLAWDCFLSITKSRWLWARIGELSRSPPSLTFYIRQHIPLALCVRANPIQAALHIIIAAPGQHARLLRDPSLGFFGPFLFVLHATAKAIFQKQRDCGSPFAIPLCLG